jgi:hypothetical protein
LGCWLLVVLVLVVLVLVVLVVLVLLLLVLLLVVMLVVVLYSRFSLIPQTSTTILPLVGYGGSSWNH